MTRSFAAAIAASIILTFTITTADAQRRIAKGKPVERSAAPSATYLPERATRPLGEAVPVTAGRRSKPIRTDKLPTIVQVATVTDLTAKRKRKARRHHVRGKSVSMAGVVAPLVAKVRQVQAACPGTIVVSARSRRGNRSNHPIGRAVDLQGPNPPCIYRQFAGWPGGISTDYHRAPGGPHYHASWNPGGQEWGLRFAHRGGGKRYASRHRGHAQYAEAAAPVTP